MNTQSLAHVRLDNVRKLEGFVAKDYPPQQEGQWIEMIVRGFFTSDQKEFYDYMKQTSSIFLNNIQWAHQVNNFLILIHQDQTADVYVNDFPIIYEGMLKRNCQAGEMLRLQDIADIRSLKFPGIEINKTDNVILSFRWGWKFGLFFDLMQWEKGHCLDIDSLHRELGWHYKRLMFQSEYAVLENRPTFQQMLGDGWFPFVQIIGGEFAELSRFYKDKFLSSTTQFVNRFNKDRIMRFVDRWWNNRFFEQKKSIILAGVEAYLTNTQAGFINCIKNLTSEIEGIIQLHHAHQDATKASLRHVELAQHLKKAAEKKFDSIEPLSFPEEFCRYINEIFLKGFDLETGNIDLSRHTALHGVAKPEDYTKVKALQCIFMLDQMYFYLS